MAPRPRGRREVLPARALASATPVRPETAPGPRPARRGFSILASLAVAAVLAIFTAQVAIAAIIGMTTNGNNTVTALTLVSPTAAAGAYTPSKVVLTWTAASPMNGQGYFIRAMNNGASAACPVAIASYVTVIGSTAGVTFTDVGAIAQGAPGTYACYLIQTGYSSAGGPPWAAVPQWTSTSALAIASVRLGVVNVQIGVGTALSPGNVVTPTLPAVSTAGTLLVAIVNAGASATQSTAPAGWVIVPTGINQPGCCRSEIWYYANNPGGINSAAFTMAAGNQGIAQMTEWKNVSTVDAARPERHQGRRRGDQQRDSQHRRGNLGRERARDHQALNRTAPPGPPTRRCSTGPTSSPTTSTATTPTTGSTSARQSPARRSRTATTSSGRQ